MRQNRAPRLAVNVYNRYLISSRDNTRTGGGYLVLVSDLQRTVPFSCSSAAAARKSFRSVALSISLSANSPHSVASLRSAAAAAEQRAAEQSRARRDQSEMPRTACTPIHVSKVLTTNMHSTVQAEPLDVQLI